VGAEFWASLEGMVKWYCFFVLHGQYLSCGGKFCFSDHGTELKGHVTGTWAFPGICMLLYITLCTASVK
jgi:hypothetical protein